MTVLFDQLEVSAVEDKWMCGVQCRDLKIVVDDAKTFRRTGELLVRSPPSNEDLVEEVVAVCDLARVSSPNYTTCKKRESLVKGVRARVGRHMFPTFSTRPNRNGVFDYLW